MSGETFTDIFNLNFASISLALERGRREEAVGCAEAAVETALEAALDRLGLGRSDAVVLGVVEDLLRVVVDDGEPGDLSGTDEDTSGSDEESSNVLIINVDSVRRDRGDSKERENPDRPQEIIASTLSSNNASKKLMALTPESISSKDSQSLEMNTEQERIEYPEMEISFNGGSSLLNTPENSNDVPEVEEGSFQGEETVPSNGTTTENKDDDINSCVPPTNKTTEEVDLTGDSDSHDSNSGVIMMENANATKDDGEDTGYDPLEIDDLGLDPSSLAMLSDMMERPSMRQIATVHPFPTPSTLPPSTNAGELEVVTIEEAAVTPPPRTMLRLRNFAVDPAMQQEHQFESSDDSAHSAHGSSWHVLDPNSVQEQVEKLTCFSKAMANLRMRCVIGTKVGLDSKYAILSSDKSIYLKLFLHDSKVAEWPNTAQGWLNVSFSFHPSGQQPSEIALVFKNISNTVFTAKLPTTDTEVDNLIEQRAPFVLSMARIKRLDSGLKTTKGRPFVKYAFALNEGRPMAVHLSGTALDLTPLFQHLSGVTSSTRVTEVMRQLTREHLTVASQHLQKNIRVQQVEDTIFKQSTGNAFNYKNLLPKDLFTRPEAPCTGTQPRALPVLTQVPVLPRVVAANQDPNAPRFYITEALPQQQSCCPFCFLPFIVRSDQFYEHVATFHYPPLSDPQVCDVAGCSVTFRTRPEHVRHVSEHTPANDSFFISGLQRLLDYLSDPGIRKEVFAQSDPKFNKSTICPLCKTQVKNMDDLFHHLTRNHFYQRLLNNIPAQERGPRRCTFSKCNMELREINAHIYHLGVFHQISHRLLSLNKDTVGPRAPLMSCPLQKCSTSNLQGVPSVILHLLTHFVTPLKFEVQKLQKVLNLLTSKCPVDRCTFTAPQGSPDSVISSVVEHYGLQHSAVIDNLFRYSGEEGLLRPNADIRMFEEHRSSVVRSPTFDCPICIKNKKKVRYGNEYACLLHLTMAHFSKQLHVMFSANFEQRGLEAGKCSQCGVSLDAAERALHVGVVHKKANDFLVEYLNEAASGTVAGVPQLVVSRADPPITVVGVAPPAAIAAKRNSDEEITITLEERTSPHPSSSSNTFSNSYYGCPKCPVKFPVANLELKVTTEKLLYKHVLSQHFANELRAKLRPILPYCPDGNCPLRTQDLGFMVEHVQTHPIYVVNFLQGQLKINSLARCYIENSPEPEIVEENEGDQALKQLYNEYKTFCKERSLRLDNCDSSFFSVFLSSVVVKKAENFSTVEKFLKKVDGMHEGPLSSSSIVSKTISALRMKMVPAEKGEKRKEEEYEDLRQTFVCLKCDRKFMVLNDLINHISSPTHIGALVGCRYCKFYQKVEHKFDSSRSLMRAFVLHGYGKNHLYNRRLFFHANKDQSIRPPELAFINYCEPCFERVEDLTEHVNKKQHVDKVKVINDFVDYCDKRDICPITCTVKDVNFHIESCRQKDIGMFQLLLVISRLHDPVEGTELCGHKLVEDKIKELNDRKDRGAFQLICYSCPFGAASLPEMYTHVTSVSHKIAVRSRAATKANNLVFCELCTMVFKSTDSILTHKYSPVHISNVNRLASDQDLVPSDKGEAYCYICDVEDDSGSHSSGAAHCLNAASADMYFKFCKDKSVNPITCRYPSLVNFFSETFGKNGVDNGSIDRALDVVDRLHLGCGKERSSIRDDSTLLRAIDNLKKSHSFSQGQGTSTAKGESEEEKKKIRSDLLQCEPPYLSSLDKKDIEKVTRCSVCHLSFKHSTYLLLHLMHIHNKLPLPFIEKEIKGKKALNCHKCIGKCSSPLAFALHHDRHQVDKYIHCKMCDKKYYSPNSYYMTDNCRANSIPALVKTTVDKAIARVVMKSSHGVIGMLFNEAVNKEEEDQNRSQSKLKRKLELDSDNDDEYDPKLEDASDESDEEDDDRSLSAMLARNPNLLGPFPKVSVTLNSRMMAERALKKGGTIHIEPSSSEAAEMLEQPPVRGGAEKDLGQAGDGAKKTPTQNRGTKRPVAAELPSSGPKSVKRTRKTTADAEIVKQCLDLLPTPKRTLVISTPPISAVKNIKASMATTAAKQSNLSAISVVKPVNAAANVVKVSTTVTPNVSKQVKAFTATSASKPACAPSTAKPASASPGSVKPGPASSRNSPSKAPPFSAGSGEYFCLNCEKCPGTDCDHLEHPRKLIGEYDAVVAHVSATGHRGFQPAANFLQVNGEVRLADLAYTRKYGNKVRKQFKKLCLAGAIECRNYEEDRKCRICDCDFSTDQVVEMFRHMREMHLK